MMEDDSIVLELGKSNEEKVLQQEEMNFLSNYKLSKLKAGHVASFLNSRIDFNIRKYLNLNSKICIVKLPVRVSSPYLI